MAWLLGTTPRRLRDRAELPRNPDGSYNGQAVIEREMTDAIRSMMNWPPVQKY